jgi:hypothetical protein
MIIREKPGLKFFLCNSPPHRSNGMFGRVDFNIAGIHTITTCPTHTIQGLHIREGDPVAGMYGLAGNP